MRNRAHSLLLLTGALPVLTLARTVLACDCQLAPPPKEALKRAEWVFQGRVTDIASDEQAGLRKVKLLVSRSWKGKLQKKQALIRTSIGGGSCGYSFQRGEEYLVYTYLRDGQQWTNICTRTAPIADAKFDLSELGPADTQP